MNSIEHSSTLPSQVPPIQTIVSSYFQLPKSINQAKFWEAMTSEDSDVIYSSLYSFLRGIQQNGKDIYDYWQALRDVRRSIMMNPQQYEIPLLAIDAFLNKFLEDNYEPFSQAIANLKSYLSAKWAAELRQKYLDAHKYLLRHERSNQGSIESYMRDCQYFLNYDQADADVPSVEFQTILTSLDKNARFNRFISNKETRINNCNNFRIPTLVNDPRIIGSQQMEMRTQILQKLFQEYEEKIASHNESVARSAFQLLSMPIETFQSYIENAWGCELKDDDRIRKLAHCFHFNESDTIPENRESPKDIYAALLRDVYQAVCNRSEENLPTTLDSENRVSSYDVIKLCLERVILSVLKKLGHEGSQSN